MRRKRRLLLVIAVFLVTLTGAAYESWQNRNINNLQSDVSQVQGVSDGTLASGALEQLEVKGRAPKTGYERAQFGDDWADTGECDMRNWVLRRDLSNARTAAEDDCTVISGTLDDPYTGKTIEFRRGSSTSSDVQIDHVVALSDAWQKGAQSLSEDRRIAFYNDPLNLLAVDGSTNVQKGDGDAATWLPPNKGFRCQYAARQIAVKIKYLLWVTKAEKDAMSRILQTCPTQILPVVEP